MSDPPVLHAVTYEDDFRSYCDPLNRREALDAVKCIPLRRDQNDYLSIGGQIRERGEYFDHPSWGQEPPDNGYSLQRYMLHTDLHIGERFRLFTDLASGLEYGRDGGPRTAIDRDTLFVHQLFGDVSLWQANDNSLLLRVGRQEMEFGASRRVSIREGPNVRQSFDGFRLTWKQGAWTTDFFATKAPLNNPGIFDDPINHASSFWGVYATRPLASRHRRNLDLYYLGLDKKKALFASGAVREQRHSVGARYWGSEKGWDYDAEGTFQFGRFGPGAIQAWGIATDTGYTFDSARLKPRIGVHAGSASGDHNPNDRDLNTFNALFPKGAYFSEAELIGPYNVSVVRPSVRFELRKNLSLTSDGEFLWRESTRDGIYRVPGVLVRSGFNSHASYIGSQANVELEWRMRRHFTATLIYLHFFPGEFLKQSQPARPVNFIAPWITYVF
jgi:hypothetical protein